MVVSSLEANITWLNVFPEKNGISKTLSPSETVIGTSKIYATHATLKPGSYVYCKIKARIKNNMKTRSVAANYIKEIKLTWWSLFHVLKYGSWTT